MFEDLLEASRDDLSALRQNRLLDESEMINFCQDRGLPVAGVVTGDPSLLMSMGWLAPEELLGGRPAFHPFRAYQILVALWSCDLNIDASSSIRRETFLNFIEAAVADLPPLEQVGVTVAQAKDFVDFAILLEPIYWPDVTSRVSWGGFMDGDERERRLARHRGRISTLIETLDAGEWEDAHRRVRYDAAILDSNDALYVLLRLAPWSKRERIGGSIGAALWLRHIVEVVRRAFEELRGVEWSEEDQGFRRWVGGARTRIYGGERFLDAPATTAPRVAFEFGLSAGTAVRWYVEGDTEYYAISSALPGAAAGGIELVNLKGAIARERGNAALVLADALEQDRRHRRFSVISFDTDVSANVKVVRRQVEQHRVVGFIEAHTPDFEFANFSISELVEVAARVDESHGVSGASLREGSWDGIEGTSAFEARYGKLSARRGGGLKGANWGSALVDFATHQGADNAPSRPFVDALYRVLRLRRIRYEDHLGRYAIDPETFELRPRAP